MVIATLSKFFTYDCHTAPSFTINHYLINSEKIASSKKQKKKRMCWLYLDLVWLDLGGFQGLNEVNVIYWTALWTAQLHEDLVLDGFQLLLHLGIANNQMVLGIFEVWPLLCHNQSQKLVFNTTATTWLSSAISCNTFLMQGTEHCLSSINYETQYYHY